MKIHLLAVGNRMPGWVETAYADYAKRLPRECNLTLREIPAGRRGRNVDVSRLVRDEGERLLAAVPRDVHLVAMDAAGKSFDSVQLASRIGQFVDSGRDLALLVGGPDGLSSACLAAASERWSLSRLTLAHPLVRVVLAEQLYRAWSIISSKPYHR